MKEFSLIKIAETTGHPNNNDLLICRLQLVSTCDEFLGNPLPHYNTMLKNVNTDRNLRGNNVSIPVLSQDSILIDENTDNEDIFDFHDMERFI